MMRAAFIALARLCLRIFFRRIETAGLEHVPASGPCIIASNHTNSLVDLLVVQFVLPRRITPTAKAALTRNPYLRFVLWLLDAVYFVRPGESADPRSAAAANRNAIEECRRRLSRGEALCLFPEGKSHSEPRMLPFKTGLARIALGCDHDVPIVPVGLNYEGKERFRSAVFIEFGPPIHTGQHSWTVAELTAEIQQQVSQRTLEFAHRREGLLLDWAARMMATSAAPPAPLGRPEALVDHVRRLRAIQSRRSELQTEHGGELIDLEKRVGKYRLELRRLGVQPQEVHLPIHAGRAAYFLLRELELVLIGGPIAVWGLLNHLLPIGIVGSIGRSLTRERDQWASNLILPATAVLPFCYLCQICLAFLLLPAGWACLYAVSLPYTGAYAVLWLERVRAAWRRLRTFVRWLLDRRMQQRLIQESRSIVAAIQNLAATG